MTCQVKNCYGDPNNIEEEKKNPILKDKMKWKKEQMLSITIHLAATLRETEYWIFEA